MIKKFMNAHTGEEVILNFDKGWREVITPSLKKIPVIGLDYKIENFCDFKRGPNIILSHVSNYVEFDPNTVQINTVMRINDDKYFTIGQEIKMTYRKNKEISRTGIIKSFTVAHDGSMIVDIRDGDNFFPAYLDEISHKPNIVLITKYGEKFYKDDICYKVDKNFNITAYTINEVNPLEHNYFRTLQHAKDYITEHKPIFTTEDVEKVLDIVFMESSSTRIFILKELTKLKNAKTNV